MFVVVCMLPTQNKKDDPSSFLSYGGNQLSKKFNSQVPKLTKVEAINKFEYKMFRYISDTQLGTKILCMLKKHHKCIIQSS
jgi:hypothetical protein